MTHALRKNIIITNNYIVSYSLGIIAGSNENE